MERHVPRMCNARQMYYQAPPGNQRLAKMADATTNDEDSELDDKRGPLDAIALGLNNARKKFTRGQTFELDVLD
jgi:hypothetical protein